MRFAIWQLFVFCAFAANQPINLLLLGNAGVGKSFLGNILCPANPPKFKSEEALVRCTTEMQTCTIPVKGVDYHIVDVPGLMDTRHVEENKKQIKRGMVLGGKYLVFYIMTLEGMRLRQEDVVTTKAVLSSYNFDPEQWMFVFNKQDKPMTEKEINERVLLLQDLTESRWVSATYVLKDEPAPQILERLGRELATLNPLEVSPESVKDIQLDRDKILQELTRAHENQEKIAAKMAQIEKDHAREKSHMERRLALERRQNPFGELLNGILGILQLPLRVDL